MNRTWDNFLQNLGEWHGSFTTIDNQGREVSSSPSILALTARENPPRVELHIRRYAPGSSYDSQPTTDFIQEYQTIGRPNVFFDTGAFCKGTIQIAPGVEFGAEYGFVAPDRRLRYVQLYDPSGTWEKLVLIREFLAHTGALERPPLTLDQLLGTWVGQATTSFADLRHPEVVTTELTLSRIGDRLQQTLKFGSHSHSSTARIDGPWLRFEDGPIPRDILLLPDGGSSHLPRTVGLGARVMVEAGWLVDDRQRQRLIRHYSDRGEWESATHVIEYRA
jgi:hypothetical protein